MKKKSSSQSAFFNVRVLIRLFIILVGIFLALLGLGGFSNVFAQPKISARDSAGLFSVPTFSAQGSYDVSRFSLPTTDGGSALDGFDPNANGPVHVVVVQPDGKILIGGDFTTLSPNGGAPVTRNHIARLNPDGTLDTAFDPNANDSVYAIAVQADGKILVGGISRRTASADRRAIASPGSMPPPAWLIRSTRTRTVLSFQSRCRRTARF